MRQFFDIVAIVCNDVKPGDRLGGDRAGNRQIPIIER